MLLRLIRIVSLGHSHTICLAEPGQQLPFEFVSCAKDCTEPSVRCAQEGMRITGREGNWSQVPRSLQNPRSFCHAMLTTDTGGDTCLDISAVCKVLWESIGEVDPDRCLGVSEKRRHLN